MVAFGSETTDSVAALQPADLTPQIARGVLQWQFEESEKARFGQLLGKKAANSLSDAEKRELDTYLALSDMLDVLHAKARAAIAQASPVTK